MNEMETLKRISNQIYQIIETNVHKSQMSSVENASECLLKLIENDNFKHGGIRQQIMTSIPSSIPENDDLRHPFLQSIINLAGITGNEYTKMFLLKSLTNLLTTSKLADQSCQTFILKKENEAEWHAIEDTCTLLSASSTKLLEIAT